MKQYTRRWTASIHDDKSNQRQEKKGRKIETIARQNQKERAFNDNRDLQTQKWVKDPEDYFTIQVENKNKTIVSCRFASNSCYSSDEGAPKKEGKTCSMKWK